MDLQKESYYVTSTFCFELFGMSQERQLKKLQAVFWPADKLNRSWYPFFTTLKICPQCIAEDEESHINCLVFVHAINMAVICLNIMEN